MCCVCGCSVHSTPPTPLPTCRHRADTRHISALSLTLSHSLPLYARVLRGHSRSHGMRCRCCFYLLKGVSSQPGSGSESALRVTDATPWIEAKYAGARLVWRGWRGAGAAVRLENIITRKNGRCLTGEDAISVWGTQTKPTLSCACVPPVPTLQAASTWPIRAPHHAHVDVRKYTAILGRANLLSSCVHLK